MSKNEFMRKLKDGLVGLNQTDKREILLDYEEHFLDGIKLGRTEEDICESLGDPAEIAANIKKETGKKQDSGNDGVNTAAYIIGIIALAIGSLWLIGFAFNVLGTLFGSVIGIFAVLALPFVLAVKILAISALVMVISISVMIIFGLVMLSILVLRWFKQMINGLTHDEDKKIKREFKMFKVKGYVWAILGIIAVLAFGGILYGALSVGGDAVRAAMNGDFDAAIANVEDLENINSESDFFDFIEENDSFPLGFVFDESKLENGNYNFAAWFGWKKTIDATETLDMTGVDTIIISASSAGINVVNGSAPEAKLTGRSRYGTEKMEVTKDGSTLQIKVLPAVGPFNSGWVNLEVVLPDNVYNSVIVKNSSGSITVVGIKAESLETKCSSGSININGEGFAYGLLAADNSSGKISVENVTDAKTVDVENASGSVVLTNVICDFLKVKNMSGRIEGQMIEAEMDIKNTSGTIIIYGTVGGGNSSVKCTSGRIELSLSDEPMDIRASASSGSVSVADNDMYNVLMDSRTSYVGEYIDEVLDTPSIDVESTSGNVDIMFH